MKKKKVQEFLLKKMTEQWMKDNPKLVEDIEKLAAEFMWFNTKWGTKFQPVDLLKDYNRSFKSK